LILFDLAGYLTQTGQAPAHRIPLNLCTGGCHRSADGTAVEHFA
jgi:hypothetical protein